MNESDARAHFRAMGIFSPSRSLIENWLRANEAPERLDEAERRPVEVASTQRNTTAERGGAVADTLVSGDDLNAAIRALQGQGLPTTDRAVRGWLAQHRPALGAPSNVATQEAPGPQTSQLEPPKEKKGEAKLARFAVPLAQAKPRRKPGRPRIVASWFPAIAKTMADGTTLRVALAINRLSLSAREMRALYRNRTFQALYQEARRRYLIENWGRSRAPSLGALLRRCL